MAAPEPATVGAANSGPPRRPPLLEVTGLKANYGQRPVLFDVSLSVAPGEIVAVFGHNGAGKTTTLSAIFGRVKPGAGTVTFDGKDITARPGIENVRRGMTLIPAEHFVFADLTVSDNLRLGAQRDRSREAIDQRLSSRYTTCSRSSPSAPHSSRGR